MPTVARRRAKPPRKSSRKACDKCRKPRSRPRSLPRLRRTSRPSRNLTELVHKLRGNAIRRGARGVLRLAASAIGRCWYRYAARRSILVCCITEESPCPLRADALTPRPGAPRSRRFSIASRRRSWTPRTACSAASCCCPMCCDDVALIVRPDDFYADAHRKLFAHMCAMHDAGKRIDTTLLVERLKTAGDFEAIGGAAYLGKIANSVPIAAHAAYYAEIVRDKATLRSLIHASTEILRDAYDESQRSRATAQPGRAEDLRHPRQPQRPAVVKRSTTSLHGGVRPHRRPHGRHARRRRRATTGFTDLDSMTGGLHDVGADHPGRPAQHGQDGAGHEHRRERRDATERAGAVRQPGNVAARIGRPLALLAWPESTATGSATAPSRRTIGRKLVEKAGRCCARRRCSSTTRPAAR